jgi:hypothetical protein
MQSRLAIRRIERFVIDTLVFWTRGRRSVHLEKSIGSQDMGMSVVADVCPVQEVTVVNNLHACMTRVVKFDEARHGVLVTLAEDGGAAESEC